MTTDYSSAYLVATLLDSWFSDYALCYKSPPQGSDKQARREWSHKQCGAWRGFSNVCRRLAEYVDGLSDPSKDSAPLWFLSGCGPCLGALPDVPDETWQAAWVLCNKLRSMVGNPQQVAVVIAEHIEEATEAARPTATKNKRRVDNRSWTQPELDAAIQAEIDKHGEAIAAAMSGKKGAVKAIKELFCRNTLADRLKIKPGSRRMVTQSRPWSKLADAVGLPRKSRQRGMAKVGLAIALEQKADDDGSNVAADVTRRETVAIIEASIQSAKGKKQKAGIADLLEKYNLGEVTDDNARAIVATLHGD